MSRFLSRLNWDEVPFRTNTDHLHFFMQLILHFHRRSGTGSLLMELMRDDRDGCMIPDRQKNLDVEIDTNRFHVTGILYIRMS